MLRGPAGSHARHARWSSTAIGGKSRRPASRPRGVPPRLEPRRSSAMSRSVDRRDGGWRVRWTILVAGDLLAAALAYLLAFLLRVTVPFPLTTGYLPPVRFNEVQHHWLEMFAAQLGAL